MVKRVLVAAGILLLGMAGVLHSQESSRVLELKLPKVIDNHWDGVLRLYYRSGRFHHGYFRLPERDNLAHRIDLNPSLPYHWELDGEAYTPPASAVGYYAYKSPEFKRHRDLYDEGRLRIVHKADYQRLQLNGDTLTGVLDLRVYRLDSVGGKGAAIPADHFRLQVNAGVSEAGVFSGTVRLWSYASGDSLYSPLDGTRELTLTGGRDDDHWQPEADMVMDNALSWPRARGPFGNASAMPSGDPLVSHAPDIRLRWVGEEIMGGGAMADCPEAVSR